MVAFDDNCMIAFRQNPVIAQHFHGVSFYVKNF
jgi:hypothetical protein